MNRFDRALAILLVLQQGKTVSATSLARQFEVSTRTIYRDVETLAAVGVPVYTEMGREGGFRLVEGFFLPPVMFSVGEGVSLLLGLTLVRSLSVRPFATELERATEKLLAAMPDHLRHTLAEAQKVVGFEGVAEDAFHVERANVAPDAGIAGVDGGAGLVVGQFLQAILDRRGMSLEYRSPYSDKTGLIAATPCGVLWDRDRWYLVGQRPGGEKQWRLWRADRVINLRVGEQAQPVEGFDIRALMNRAWLREAMEDWIEEGPVVVIRLTRSQADRVRGDWYYQHARFEETGEGVVMTLSEVDQAVVLELVRWLGPGAELLEPVAWREVLDAELRAMLQLYVTPTNEI